MINPEKLLGGLLLGRGGLAGRSGLGLGLLGVALEAAEHYMHRQGSSRPSIPSATPPPPPAPSSAVAVPPPPPGGATKTDGGLSPATAAEDAVLLIRAMIAAANADGNIDSDERSRILRRLKSLDLSTEEQAFITQELLTPGDIESVASQVKTPQMAEQVFAASLAAITVDTQTERKYLQRLARRLGIDDATRQRISTRLRG